MSKRRIIAFSVGYLAVVAACLAVGFELTMDRFDHGGEPTLVEQGTAVGASVLLAPADQIVGFLGRERFGPAGQWLMLLGNALLWGFAAEVAYTLIRDKIRGWR